MNKNIKSKTLKFKYQNGVTTSGKAKYAYNTISNVDTQVSDDILFGILALIVKVQETPSEEVEVSETAIMK